MFLKLLLIMFIIMNTITNTIFQVIMHSTTWAPLIGTVNRTMDIKLSVHKDNPMS